MYKNVLVPVSLSADTQLTERAMKDAVQLSLPTEGILHVVTVIPGYGSPWVASQFPQADMEDLLDEVYEQLRTLVNPMVPDDVPVKLSVVDGNPYKGILREAERTGADLIVIPSRSHNRAESFLLGSVAARVVERADTSVLVVR